ncbi:MAG: PPC domain-containing protein [Dehalococcoidia bacterium]|nr:PPC domain-containing protein [Dehalococcoidia bacterium]
MKIKTPAISLPIPGMYAFALACAVVALAALLLTLGGAPVAWSQESPDCEVIDLGTLDSDVGSVLQADGRWTTEDCDSRFLDNSDAHTYRFRLSEDGQVRVNLTSAEGDSYLHLLSEDGGRIAHDDDSDTGLDSRIEANLVAGVYLVEAAAGAGRGRGPADFTLSIQRAVNCEPTDLGSLEPGAVLTVEGAWNLDDCGGRFREDTPARTYRFNLPQDGMVRIDLTGPEGSDPYLYLLSSDGGYLYDDDDGGAAGYNSRIENDLAAGTYLIEATTYSDRDHAHVLTEFNLTVRIGLEALESFHLKAEAIHIPDQVVRGEPVAIHYRVGNAGRTDLTENYSAEVLLVAKRVLGPYTAYEKTDMIAASDGRWGAGASYHSGQQTASVTSASISEVAPFDVSFRRSGPTWVLLAVITYDEAGEEVGFHRILKEDLVVLDRFAFGPITVKVGDMDYEVLAEADEEGAVTTSVTSVEDPSSEVDPETWAKAVYAAGVHTQKLEGIFKRPAISDLPVTEKREEISVSNPSSDTLLEMFTDQYVSAIAASGLSEAMANGEVVNPITVEDLVLSAAETAGARYASLAASWSALQDRIEGDGVLSFTDAFTVQFQLAYAESLISPLIAGGEAVQEARAAEMGWQDEGVQEMVAELEERVSCGSAGAALRRALGAAGVEDVAGLLNLDTEMRAALPSYGLVNDSISCAATAADGENNRFLENLAISDNGEILRLFGYELPPVPPVTIPPHRLRILSRMGEDGRIEHGVELSDGERMLPDVRHLPADATIGQWRVSSDVEVDGNPIGRIRTRLLADGRIELGFLSANGEEIMPDVRYLPADMPAGVWMRSSEIEVSRVEVLE